MIERDDDLELERYELREVLVGASEDGTTRREFLKVLGGGLVVVLITRDALGAPAPHSTAAPQQNTDEIAAWLHVAGDGAITVYTGKVEFGQGIRTSLAQMVAEELRVPLTSVRLVMGDTDLTPFDQGTFGSRSTPQMGTQLRTAAAAARELLIGLAAERWSLNRTALSARDGTVSDGRERSIPYGELTAGRRLTETVRADAGLRPAAQWTIAGMDVPKVDARAMVTGRHRFTSDMRVPGMVHGKVLRPPAIGSRLSALDDADASSSRTPHGRCVPVQTVSFSPSASRVHCATAARGSSGTWAM